MNGLTFTVCFGSYGGFYFNRWRVCLGWVAFTVYAYDLESAIAILCEQSGVDLEKPSRAQEESDGR